MKVEFTAKIVFEVDPKRWREESGAPDWDVEEDFVDYVNGVRNDLAGAIMNNCGMLREAEGTVECRPSAMSEVQK